jgi:alkylated DNA repair dioxygenase AlkB
MNDDISRFDYINEFISNDEEQALVQAIRLLPLARLKMRGQLTHRRVASFGLEYDGRRRDLVEAAPIPDTFAALQRRISASMRIEADRLRSALVTEYPPRAKIGAHVDNRSYGSIICGVSLLGAGVMTVGLDGQKQRIEIQPRSLYVMRGAVRWYPHEVVARDHRYSITFRTIAAEETDRYSLEETPF